MRRAISTLYRVRSLALQPLPDGNSAEFSQADNSKTIIQHRATNLTSLDSLGFCESIYVHFKPPKNELNHFKDNRITILNLFWLLMSEHKMARKTKIQSF